MNVATTAAVDLARLVHTWSLPSRKRKHGGTRVLAHYSPEVRARKKRQREARKPNRP